MLVGHDRRPRLIRSNLEYVTLARLFLLAANHRERRRHSPSTLGPGWSKPSFLGPGWSKTSFLGKKVGIFFFACGGLEDLPTYHGCAVTRETQPLVCTVHASPARSPDSASNGFQSAPPLGSGRAAHCQLARAAMLEVVAAEASLGAEDVLGPVRRLSSVHRRQALVGLVEGEAP